jgi:hypothetical protein
VKILNFEAWGHVLIVLFFAGIFILAAGFTLTTTQLLFMYGVVSPGALHYSWEVLLQLDQAIHGGYSGTQLIAVMLSWLLLGCYCIANTVKKWIKAGIAHDGLHLFCHAMMILDGIANWVFLAGYPWYYQVLFTLGIYTILSHFGKVIMSHAELAIHGFFEA